jgi:hypothetical protein
MNRASSFSRLLHSPWVDLRSRPQSPETAELGNQHLLKGCTPDEQLFFLAVRLRRAESTAQGSCFRPGPFCLAWSAHRFARVRSRRSRPFASLARRHAGRYSDRGRGRLMGWPGHLRGPATSEGRPNTGVAADAARTTAQAVRRSPARVLHPGLNRRRAAGGAAERAVRPTRPLAGLPPHQRRIPPMDAGSAAPGQSGTSAARGWPASRAVSQRRASALARGLRVAAVGCGLALLASQPGRPACQRGVHPWQVWADTRSGSLESSFWSNSRATDPGVAHRFGPG